MQIVKTTDNRFIGVNIESMPSIGDVLVLKDFDFEVANIVHLHYGNWLLINPNYQIELEE